MTMPRSPLLLTLLSRNTLPLVSAVSPLTNTAPILLRSIRFPMNWLFCAPSCSQSPALSFWLIWLSRMALPNDPDSTTPSPW